MSRAGLTLTVINETKQLIDEAELSQHLELILRRLEHAVNLNIEVIFVGDQRIKQLNNQFRGYDQPTDVLSFPAPTQQMGDLPQPSLGSIAISTETAARQADAAGTTLTTELNSLAGHGLLHLLGYHHAEHSTLARKQPHRA